MPTHQVTQLSVQEFSLQVTEVTLSQLSHASDKALLREEKMGIFILPKGWDLGTWFPSVIGIEVFVV